MKKYKVSKDLYLAITTNWLNGLKFPLMEIYDSTGESEASETSAMRFPNWENSF